MLDTLIDNANRAYHAGDHVEARIYIDAALATPDAGHAIATQYLLHYDRFAATWCWLGGDNRRLVAQAFCAYMAPRLHRPLDWIDVALVWDRADD